MAKTQNNDNLPAVNASKYLVIQEDISTLNEIVQSNIGANGVLSPFDLEQARVPGGGSLSFQISGLEDSEVKELEGILVYFRDLRAWYEVAFADRKGEKTPPDCMSQDTVHGIGKFGPKSEGNPSGLCADCPMSQWKSDRKGGAGQDCHQVRAAFLMREESLLPIQFRVPPTSLSAFRKHLLALAGRKRPFYSVILRMELKKEKNGAGIDYAQLAFKPPIFLQGDELAKAHAMAVSMRALLDNTVIEVGEGADQPAE